MATLETAHRFRFEFLKVRTAVDLKDLLAEVCSLLGCSFYALTHHVDFLGSPDAGLRVHNYPEDWVHWFDSQRLGVDDPVHRASRRTAAGFAWRDVPKMVQLRPADAAVLDRARRHGIGEGLTIPAHVPGEAHGSCSFAWGEAQTPELRALAFAQSISAFAFEAARSLYRGPVAAAPRLTDRQRECLVWAARGKTDPQISRILGIRHGTVVEHMRNARRRYEAPTRARLAVRALFDGALHFGEVGEP